MTARPTAAPRTPGLSFDLIVAADEQGGIGCQGDLPWKLPGDMSYFRKLTIGTGRNAVIMGRKTWASIPERFRPLSKRLNVVLSRSQPALPSEVRLAASLDDALAQLATEFDHGPPERIFLIGGGSLYAEALEHPACQKIYLTRVSGTFDCDIYLPNLDELWHEIPDADLPDDATDATQFHQDNGIRYRYCCLTRRPTTS